ncbi:MAG: hypothetical protein ABJC74_03000, partial [Gemmatimonadota bacterium]
SSIAFTVMYVVFPLYLERAMHYDRRHTAYFFVLLGLVTAGAQGGLMGRVVRRFGERRVMEAGCVIVAVGLMALPLVTGATAPTGIRLPGPVLAGVLSGVLGSPLTFMAMALVALAGGIGGITARGTRKLASI